MIVLATLWYCVTPQAAPTTLEPNVQKSHTDWLGLLIPLWITNNNSPGQIFCSTLQYKCQLLRCCVEGSVGCSCVRTICVLKIKKNQCSVFASGNRDVGECRQDGRQMSTLSYTSLTSVILLCESLIRINWNTGNSVH